MMLEQLLERDVNIGVSGHIGSDHRHGLVWIEGDVGQKPAIVPVLDKPELLNAPLNFFNHRRLFRQLTNMGLKPTHLEFEVGDARRTYVPGKHQPVLEIALH
jgi:hypothetical protein